MRRVVSELFISLDGDPSAQRVAVDNFDEDMMAELNAHIAREDAVLLGRVRYQEWACYWPTSTDEPYASHINNTPKYVVSTTLKKVDWQNSRLIRGDLGQEIAKMKKQPGKNIGVAGSRTLVESLLQNDLLDELVLMMHPMVVGHGKRLFKDGRALKGPKLVDSRTARTRVAILVYQSRSR